MNTNLNEPMMQRCLQLAKNGLGATYPNPMVGCVIVYDKEIIAEGWHQKAGEEHAEVHAISQVQDKEVLKNSTLYVSLEPCAHYGKTPPCADLIIQSQIPKVVIGTKDPFSKVNGLGIKKIQEAGIEVEVGVLEKECRDLNNRFFTFHQKKRPYIILKWAQTANGYIAGNSNEQVWISNEFSKQLVHKWRTEEQGILVGTNTARIDNPQLNARLWSGDNPIRIVLDKELKLDEKLYLFDGSQKTMIFTEKKKESSKNVEFHSLDFDDKLLENLLDVLHKKGIQSLIIEGGKETLQSFIEKEFWDEARIIQSSENWSSGVLAPELKGELVKQFQVLTNQVSIYKK